MPNESMQKLRLFWRKWAVRRSKKRGGESAYVHPGERVAAGIFALAPASGLVASYFPQYRGVQDVLTICVAFISPLFLIYSARRSRPRRTGNALLSSFLAMFILVFSYADIYLASGLVIDTTIQPMPRPISLWRDAVYFSVVTWTTLGYGDLQPQGLCRLIAASEALVGNIFLGTIIALMFTFMTETKES